MLPIVFLSDAQVWGIALACVMMVADMVVGFIVAVINENLSSTKMRNGLLHKVLMLVLIFVCLVIEVSISHTGALPYDVPTCEVVCSYIVLMELVSVLENIANGYPELRDSALFRLFNLDNEKSKDE
jgi:toxin secretion/phage lysis holin